MKIVTLVRASPVWDQGRLDEPWARLVDGEMTSWYGSRAIAGLDYLAEYPR